VRLDLFLKASRLVLRRSVARQLCDLGRINVNGTAAKASKEIKAGDEIEIIRGEKRTVVRVLQTPHSKQVSKQAASSLVEIVTSEAVEDELLS
jgi:ribosomal 50S subunit-recycling heat shock protein